MKKRWGKRGQFYLVAAIVLAAVIIGIFSVVNYAEKGKNDELYNLRDGIKIEGEKTIDYGTRNGFGRVQMNQLLENFIDHYVNYEESREKNIYFIFGNENEITLSGKQLEDKVISISSGATQTQITNVKGRFSGSIDPLQEVVTVSIDGTEYNFKLMNGENFYFIITQEISGGKYVVIG